MERKIYARDLDGHHNPGRRHLSATGSSVRSGIHSRRHARAHNGRTYACGGWALRYGTLIRARLPVARDDGQDLSHRDGDRLHCAAVGAPRDSPGANQSRGRNASRGIASPLRKTVSIQPVPSIRRAGGAATRFEPISAILRCARADPSTAARTRPATQLFQIRAEGEQAAITVLHDEFA